MSEGLMIHWGDENTKKDNPPMEYEFNSSSELNAFISGVELSIASFPEEPDDDDLEVSEYNVEEQTAFYYGVEQSAGFSDYTMLQQE